MAQVTVEIFRRRGPTGRHGCIEHAITVETSADAGDIDRQLVWVSLGGN
jgi:hypothetical protein